MAAGMPVFRGIGMGLGPPEISRALMRAQWDIAMCRAQGLPDPHAKGPGAQAGRRHRSASMKAADAWDRAMSAARSGAGS